MAGYGARSRHRRQIHIPDSVVEPIGAIGRQLQCQASLAASTGAGHRQQAVLVEQASGLDQFPLAADERAELARKVRPTVVDADQGGEVGHQVGMLELEHIFGTTEILQPVHPKVSPAGPGREPVRHQVSRGARGDHLTTVCQRSEASSPNDRLPEVVERIALLGVAGVQRHPD